MGCASRNGEVTLAAEGVPAARERGGSDQPAASRGGDGMSHSAELERRYRRLLAWYPRVYWRDHEGRLVDQVGDRALAFVGGVQVDQCGPR